MVKRRLRVLVIASHVVQYTASVFRRAAVHPSLDFHVAYCSLRGAEAGHDAEFGSVIQWDVPLLDGYDWIEVINKGSGSESFWGLFNPGLWNLIRKGGFHAVICFTGYIKASFWIAYFASRTSDTRFLFGTDATKLGGLRSGQRWKVPVKKYLWPRLFGLADQILVPSSGGRDLMLTLGFLSERITLTPYSVDNDWWMKQSLAVEPDGARARWEIKPDDFVVLFCAKLQTWKRPFDLLRAFAHANLKGAQLIFAGDGPLRTELESEAIALGIDSQVRFVGFVNQSQLPSLYTAADIMVLPSEYEAFGVVVNEAMCCGCPVISSDSVGASRDLIATITPEFIYSCGDTTALANILQKIFENRGQLKAIRSAVRTHMLSWSPEQNVDATVDAISRAVARGEL
jgi:glycosyltransferase involved in cell wall biosynthesis